MTICLVALPGTKGVAREGDRLHVWNNGAPLCGDASFMRGVSERRKYQVPSIHFVEADDPRRTCRKCIASLDSIALVLEARNEW